MSLAVRRVTGHSLVTEQRSHAVIIRPITRSLPWTSNYDFDQPDTRRMNNVILTLFWHMLRCDSVWPLTCGHGCSGPARLCSADQQAACGCQSRVPGRWRWWLCGWSPAPARTRWKSGWRKYCALPAMGNKEINKKAKAPLRRHTAQLRGNSEAKKKKIK